MLIKALSRNVLQTVGMWFETVSRPLSRSKSVIVEEPRTKEAGVLYFVVYKSAPMRVEHLALWVDDLERMRQFYLAYFNMVSSEKHGNDGKGSASYFLSFNNGKNRVELRNRLSLRTEPERTTYLNGIDHFAITVDDKETVDRLVERLRAHNYSIANEPAVAESGHYESIVLDPEGNHVKITAGIES